MRVRLASVVLFTALAPATALAQFEPAITLVSPDPATSGSTNERPLNREEIVEDNVELFFEWNASTAALGSSYGYEITIGAARSSDTDTNVKLVPVSRGEAEGTLVSGNTYQFAVRANEVVTSTAADTDSGSATITVRVYETSQPYTSGYFQTKSWTVRWDTKRPPAPVLTEAGVVAGEERLQVTWSAPSVTTDVEGYEVFWTPETVTSTPGAYCDKGLMPDPDTWKSKISIAKSTTTVDVTEGLKNGVPAIVAVRTVDAAGNKGEFSVPCVERPRAVDDFFEVYNGNGGGEKGGFCFIATAAYGSYAHPTVFALRAFRDLVLKRTPFGTALVWVYYRLSPPLALKVASDPALARAVRVVLWPAALMAALLVLAPLFGAGVVLSRVAASRRARRATARAARLGGAAALAVVAAASLAPRAAEAGRPDPTGTLGFGFEFRGGPFRPTMGGAVGAGGTDSFEIVFGTNPNPLFTLGAEIQLYRGIGTLGLGGSFGFMQFVGKGRFADTKTAAPDTTVFNLLPLNLVAVYRFEWLADRTWVPLVPYVRGGLAYHVWWVTNGKGDIARYTADTAATADDAVGRGGKIGVTGTLGMAIMLNNLEPNAARSLYETTDIRGTYLFAEYQVSKVDGFGAAGFDLSDSTWNLGIYLEL